MARLLAVVLIALSLAAGSAAPATAQLGRALIGAGVGVAGGSVITMSAIVARARFQREYIDSVEDLIHWQTIPMIAAPAAGTVFAACSVWVGSACSLLKVVIGHSARA